MDLTDQDLDQIASRCRATLQGPWQSFIEGRDHCSGDDFIQTGTDTARGPDIYISLFGPDDDAPNPAPAEVLDFVATARQDIPRLIAEIRRLRSADAGTR